MNFFQGMEYNQSWSSCWGSVSNCGYTVQQVTSLSKTNLTGNAFMQLTAFFSTECRDAADIGFLMDGSGSVDTQDFEKMKEFVIRLIGSLLGKNSQVEFFHFILKSLNLHVKIGRERITLFTTLNFSLHL